MSTKTFIAAIGFAAALFLIPTAQAQSVKGKLATAKNLKCMFPLMAVGNWTGDKPKAEVKASNLVLQFVDVNTDEGSARMESSVGGTYEIIVRYAGGYL